MLLCLFYHQTMANQNAHGIVKYGRVVTTHKLLKPRRWRRSISRPPALEQFEPDILVVQIGKESQQMGGTWVLLLNQFEGHITCGVERA